MKEAMVVLGENIAESFYGGSSNNKKGHSKVTINLFLNNHQTNSSFIDLL